jgi:hypothetical protein
MPRYGRRRYTYRKRVSNSFKRSRATQLRKEIYPNPYSGPLPAHVRYSPAATPTVTLTGTSHIIRRALSFEPDDLWVSGVKISLSCTRSGQTAGGQMSIFVVSTTTDWEVDNGGTLMIPPLNQASTPEHPEIHRRQCRVHGLMQVTMPSYGGVMTLHRRR